MRLFGRSGGAPVATYAAVLDGAHLWLEVTDGPVTLRETGSRDRHEVAEGPVDLGRLGGTEYDVLVGRARVQLLTDPPHSPLTPDGTGRWQVSGPDLRLTRAPVTETAELAAIDLRGDRVHLRLRPPTGVETGTHLLLQDQEDRPLSTVSVTAHDGLLEALLGVDDLPAGYFGMIRLAVGTDSHPLRVRRRADVLTDANHAVLLPELYDGEHLRARFRWNPDGLLALRSINPAEDA